MINRVVLVGRMTKDPELRYTPNGVATASFTLATNRPFTNQNGEREADFIQIVTWRAQAENCAKYTSKGSLVGVDGRIQTRSYDNNEGRRIFVTEVVADSVQFLDTKKESNPDNGGYKAPTSNTNFSDDPFANDGTPIDISSDDLPF